MSEFGRRILFVDHTAVLGGAQLSLFDIAVHLRGRGAVALFENGPLAARLVGSGVAVLPVAIGDALRRVKKTSRVPSPSALLASANAVWELSRLARSFAVICANSPKSFLVAAGAGLLARRPVVWHLRDILDRSHFSNTNRRLMTGVANARAARVIANSRATADAFVAAGGRRSLVTVVHNGIDPVPFDVSGQWRDALRASLGFAASDFVVGSFSRLHPWKGQRVLFDALELVPGVRALVVGGALFSGEAEFERELAERAAGEALAGRVVLLGAREDVPALMGACDAIAHTSVAPEPFGRVLVEALLARRPLIASDAGGVREIATHNVSALLTPPGNVAALAEAMRALRDDASLRQRLAAAGFTDVRERFSRDKMVAGVTAVLDHVIAEATR